jgi:hypothetical protein
VSDKIAANLNARRFGDVDWNTLHYDYYVASVRDAKKVHPGVVPWVKLPDTTLRIDVFSMLLLAAGVPDAKVAELMAWINDIVKYNGDSDARKASLLTLANVFMKELQADYTGGAGGSASVQPVGLRVSDSSGAARQYEVYNNARGVDHDNAQAADLLSAASPSKRARAKADSSNSPPTQKKTGAGQNARSGAAASEGRFKGAIAVSNTVRWKPGSRTTHVQVSKDGDVLAIHNDLYDLKKFKRDVNTKTEAGKRAVVLKYAAVFMLNEGTATTAQRLIYVPAGAPPSGVKGDPFADFNALDYYKEDAKFLASDF